MAFGTGTFAPDVPTPYSSSGGATRCAPLTGACMTIGDLSLPSRPVRPAAPTGASIHPSALPISLPGRPLRVVHSRSPSAAGTSRCNMSERPSPMPAGGRAPPRLASIVAQRRLFFGGRRTPGDGARAVWALRDKGLRCAIGPVAWRTWRRQLRMGWPGVPAAKPAPNPPGGLAGASQGVVRKGRLPAKRGLAGKLWRTREGRLGRRRGWETGKTPLVFAPANAGLARRTSYGPKEEKGLFHTGG